MKKKMGTQSRERERERIIFYRVIQEHSCEGLVGLERTLVHAFIV